MDARILCRLRCYSELKNSFFSSGRRGGITKRGNLCWGMRKGGTINRESSFALGINFCICANKKKVHKVQRMYLRHEPSYSLGLWLGVLRLRTETCMDSFGEREEGEGDSSSFSFLLVPQDNIFSMALF